MPKILEVDMEDLVLQHSNAIFEKAVEIVHDHGVCYMRFTKEAGIELIKPEYNQRINGVIANA